MERTSGDTGLETSFKSTFTLNPKGKGKELNPDEDLVKFAGVTLFEHGMYHSVNPQSDGLAKDPRLGIYNTWPANLVHTDNGDYLVLPDDGYEGNARGRGRWQDYSDDNYPANAIYVRSCYVE